MNSQYERLLTRRNRWDAQVCVLDNPDDLLEAVVRRHLTKGKPQETAALLYKYADIVSVKGIDDTPEPAPKPEPEVEPRPSAFKTISTIIASGLIYGLALIGIHSIFMAIVETLAK